jgi:hypothetical protein
VRLVHLFYIETSFIFLTIEARNVPNMNWILVREFVTRYLVLVIEGRVYLLRGYEASLRVQSLFQNLLALTADGSLDVTAVSATAFFFIADVNFITKTLKDKIVFIVNYLRT